VPRDAWMLDRKNTQASEEFFSDSIGANALQMEAIVAADSIPDLFERLEQAGVLLRLDQSLTPKCSTAQRSARWNWKHSGVSRT
jgi:hypothetical protein